jgi:hypothetical protein
VAVFGSEKTLCFCEKCGERNWGAEKLDVDMIEFTLKLIR